MFDIESIKFDEHGLVPCIVQDWKTRDVLMLAYMNKEAVELSWKTAKATFYSRSKQKIWVKGESHGTFLPVVTMYNDCDNDTILMVVDCPSDYNICHTRQETCFGPKCFSIEALAKFIDEYAGNERPDSYTKTLLECPDRTAQKVGEEAVETVIEAIKGNKLNFINECADLIYHLLVLMKTQDVKLSAIEKVLKSRHH